MTDPAIERAPRGMSWKRGGAGLYFAHLGDGRVAFVERDERGWVAWIRRVPDIRILERAKAATLRGAQAWAERRR